MHYSDDDLSRMLLNDETTADVQAIAVHVESCAACQQRLQVLTVDAEWSHELISELRTVSDEELAYRPSGSTISIELCSSLLNDDQDEVDTVSLEFLGPPRHPELLGRLGRYDIERLIGAGGYGNCLQSL